MAGQTYRVKADAITYDNGRNPETKERDIRRFVRGAIINFPNKAAKEKFRGFINLGSVVPEDEFNESRLTAMDIYRRESEITGDPAESLTDDVKAVPAPQQVHKPVE